MFLRQLEYLTVLSRERHFGRAALACQVSQPALSTAIAKLERELGLPLVHRRHRYDDLTPEGAALLRWAHQVQAGVSGLETEAARLRQEMTGRLRLGVIPTALEVMPLIARPLLDSYPDIQLEVRSLSSRQISQRLANFELDAGLTYLDNEPLGDVESAGIYTERYVLLSPTAVTASETIDWAALGDHRLCLLTSDTQNRRMIDSVCAQVGLELTTHVEADSVAGLLAFALSGWSCVMAEAWLALRGPPPGMSSVALVNPTVTHRVGLVTRRAEIEAPLVRLLREMLSQLDVDAALTKATVGAAPTSG